MLTGRRRRAGAFVVTACVMGLALTWCGTKGDEAAPSTARPSASPSAAPPGPGSGSGEDKGRGAEPLPGLPSAGEARAELARLVVAAPRSMSGYSRARFPHWAQQGHRCDTRETVLARDGRAVRRDAECRAVSGAWHSLYDGKDLKAASEVDIDHIVPLANAWRSGADAWDTERRKAFANDLTHPQLLTVSAGSNRAKGDQSPDQWQPPDTAAWCVYGRAWTSVKSTYGLTVTNDERAMLTKMLGTCPS